MNQNDDDLKQPDNHFFASSVATWMTTTDKRDLHEVLSAMEREGFDYNLFLVPGSHEAPYRIRQYAPQVEGAQWVGYFQPKRKRRS
jgi:hypothetical protein